MARQKTNKTVKKRVRLSNPRGNRKAKILYFQSSRNHLKTGKSARYKRRQKGKSEVYDATKKTIVRKVVNL
jgi:ribosomal protein L35